MTSVEHFVAHLKKRGIEWMATLCGHGLNPLFDAASRAGMRLIDTRNEQTASYVADYWGKLTGRAGVCCVSSGVAHANALTGVTNAWFDRSPMLLISGAGALRTAGMGHFQDMDQVSMAVPVTKFARVIDVPERAVQILDEALSAAEAEPRGPVHLTYPMDVQTTPVRRPMPPAASLAAEQRDSLEAVEAALARARRPLIVAGSGVFYSGQAAAVLEFAKRTQAPLVQPIWDRGIADEPHPAYCGVIGAATGGAGLLADADCLIVLGAPDDYRVGFLQTKSVTVTSGFAGLAGISCPPHTAWLAEARRRVMEHRSRVEAMPGASLMTALRQTLTPETALLIDGGSIGQWAHQVLCSERYPGHWLTCGRSGVVGWGLGGAMAARLARPQSPVVLLSGDGAFTFTVAELECAVRQKLPFVAIVADDQAWGITKVGHEQEYGKAIASALGPIDFVKLAQSLGAQAKTVKDPTMLAKEVRKAIQSNDVMVLHVPIQGGNP